MNPHLTLINGGIPMGADRTIHTRRTYRPAITKEPTLMSSYLGLNHLQAESHRQDLLAEARMLRRVIEAERVQNGPAVGPRLIESLRRAVGFGLVRLGQRLHGAGVGATVDSAPNMATFRVSR